MRKPVLTSLTIYLAFSATTTFAQSDAAPRQPAKPTSPDIIVTAERLPGSVITDKLPLQVLNPADIAAYGASDLGDLLDQLKPKTKSNGGRGDEGPVILINGRRISDPVGLASLPPEAMLRVEIYPETVALEQGFSAGQRVVNIVLQKSYSATTVNVGAGGAGAGNYQDRDGDLSLFQIEGDTRISLSARYSKNGSVTARARGIIDEPGEGFANDERTLVPASETASITGSIARAAGRNTNFTFSFGTSLSTSRDILGVSSSSPPLVAQFGPTLLSARSKSKSANAGISLNGKLGDWLWSTDAKWNRTVSNYVSDRDNDEAALSTDRTNYVTQFIAVETTLGGTVVNLPAGKGRALFQIGGDLDEISGSSYLDNAQNLTNLSRRRLAAAATFEIPIASREKNVLSPLGDLMFTGRIANRRFSDAGDLSNWSMVLNWSPIKRFSVISTWIGQLDAPSLSRLGEPARITPFRVVYDFVRGDAAFASIITGGNPNLLPERRRDFKLQLNWKPLEKADLNLMVLYANIRATNSPVSAPLFTQAVEAALPGRVVRGPDGRIVSIDQRDVNIAFERGEQINWSLNYMQRFGKGVAAGNWSFNVNYRMRLRDERQIRAGLPVLDYHNGAAFNFLGGVPVYEVHAAASWYRAGKGVNLNGAWRAKTSVFEEEFRQTGGERRLTFSPLLSINLRAFVDIDQSAAIIKVAPFLRSTSITLNIGNLLGNTIEVRDRNRLVPFSYQRGYLDPSGRTVEIKLRKQF